MSGSRAPSNPAPSAVELLADILLELRGLRDDFARDSPRRPVSPLSREDRTLLGRLLPAVGGVFGSELFLTRDLFESDAQALRLVLRGLNAKHVGRLLRRAADTPIAGYMIQREGLEAGAVLWRVVQVPEFPGNEKVSVPHAPSRGLA